MYPTTSIFDLERSLYPNIPRFAKMHYSDSLPELAYFIAVHCTQKLLIQFFFVNG